MNVPDIDFTIETERLVLEPVTENHAEIMVGVISNPDLYTYIPFDPPTVDMLKSRYKRWEAKISADKDEIQLNWVARIKSSNVFIGDFQVGYKEDGHAYIAYMIATTYQKNGYAAEGLKAVIQMLFEKLEIVSIKAWIDTRNEPSIQLVKNLGMEQVDFIPNADHFKGMDSDEVVFEIRHE